jgi:hypothetical protein
MDILVEDKKQLEIGHDYPLIDNDPHFLRVLRYARLSDYMTVAIGTAVLPAAWLFLTRTSRANPGTSRRDMRALYRSSILLGFCGGFLIAYQNVCKRFLGFVDNKREYDMDIKEMKGKIARGEPLYGVSSLSPRLQTVAARNSRNSSFTFHILPWFNFVNHPDHGVDSSRYKD